MILPEGQALSTTGLAKRWDSVASFLRLVRALSGKTEAIERT